jgi:acetate kinase
MIPALGRIDAIVFSGSGASYLVIEEVCRRLPYMNIQLADHPSRRVTALLSARKSKITILRAAINEEDVLFDEAAVLLPTLLSRSPKNLKRPR